MKFEIGDHVFLKITPVTIVGRLIKSNKLSPRYLGPFQILEKYGTAAYKLVLPPNLANIHDVFHVSQLKRYFPNSTHVIEHENVHLHENMMYEVRPDRIIDARIKSLRNKQISLVKFVWKRLSWEEATWETEEHMRQQYPELFD